MLRDYFTSRSRDLLGRVISVTGHSHCEAYAGEWGSRCIGLESGENIAFTQSKLAFARGAARQRQLPCSVQVSPWFAGACTTCGPLRQEGRRARGLDVGHSLSRYERLWLHTWYAGAAIVTRENSIAIIFEKPAAPWTLTAHGRKAAEVFQFMRAHDRGVPFTPVAIVLDHLVGDIESDDELIAKLERALQQGRTVLLGAAHPSALAPRLARLAQCPGVDVLEPWIHLATGPSTAIPDSRLQRLVRQTLPVEVAGDPIQYQSRFVEFVCR